MFCNASGKYKIANISFYAISIFYVISISWAESIAKYAREIK